MSAKLSPLAKGETVMVFHDPVTCQNLEGNAVLVKRHAVNSEGSERWQVRFEDDGFMAVRTVWKKHVI